MNTFSRQLAELAGITRCYIQENYQSGNKIVGTIETAQHFQQIIAGPEKFPFPGKSPDQGNHIPPRSNPKPIIPPIQKPLPPPLRKPISSPTPNGEPFPKKNADTIPSSGFALEKMDGVKQQDLNDIRKLYTERFPHLPVLDIPPDRSITHKPTQKTAESFYPQVALLSFSGNPKLLDFMGNIVRAIHLRWNLRAEILPAHQWEQEKAWEGLLDHSGLKLILASDYGLQTLQNLASHHREAQRQGQHFLKNTPLLLLSDLTLYLREPHLKQSLWQAICAKLN